ncbi:polysaccharide pyruvyl transferase family protein [Saccharibacillus sp. CPCC 101409]|uniref:polysaccharide pyruvyl transferase family protein n=1 Tax=Saccharibacillus sp. CPCC 101409 TaxID=3058041 RepID=UPI002673F2AD|nr:polysaccharide pyruvyl transferase family protein [Saccharibacillus sp. CPCC 101409]MDO3411683.1 polysaccharide pyruvyl transferase family protein [Saccharibacillus sp. CPCC 101409]
MGKILIVGGQMENKGAQAMTFTVINEIKKRYPDKEILVNCVDPDRGYAFDIVKIGKKLKIEMLGGLFGTLGKLIPGANHVNVTRADMERIMKDTDMMIDISGFALSSQFTIRHSVNYLVNIMLAKRYKVPMVLMPQSFGPFDYESKYKSVIMALIKKYMTYPTHIYAREDEGMQFLSPYTTGNLKRSVDLVLQGSSEYNLDVLFKPGAYQPNPGVIVKDNSAAIVPNVKTMKYGSREDLLQAYGKMTDHLLKRGMNVYLLRHSTEDLEICKGIKQNYPDDERVVLLEEEYDCIEIHHILNQFQFIIASRYHSIIHAYKNGIPVLALGWATKYQELLGRFGQKEYMFDVRDLSHVERDIESKIDRMIEHRGAESGKISDVLAEIQSRTIFSEVFGELPAAQSASGRDLDPLEDATLQIG